MKAYPTKMRQANAHSLAWEQLLTPTTFSAEDHPTGESPVEVLIITLFIQKTAAKLHARTLTLMSDDTR